MSRPTYVWGQSRRTQEREEGEQSEHTDEEDDIVDSDEEEMRGVSVNLEPAEDHEPHLQDQVLDPVPLDPTPLDPVPLEHDPLVQPQSEPSLVGRLENFVQELRAYSENEAHLREINTTVTIQNLTLEQEINTLRAENQGLKRRNEALTDTIAVVEKQRDEFRADFEIYKHAAREKFMKP